MAKSRLELHEELCYLLGSRNVYFQPPEGMILDYPCIVYNLSYIQSIRADNIKYLRNKQYSVTIIDEDPDSELPDKMLERFQYCRFDRPFVTEDLNHWVFDLYF